MTESSSTEAPKNLEPWLELNNKVVMVTGAEAGLGREFCLDLARAGCRIIAAARRMDWLRSLCDEINGNIGSSDGEPGQVARVRAVGVELDVSASGAAIEASVQKAWDAFGTIDALINNACVRSNRRSFRFCFLDSYVYIKGVGSGTSLPIPMDRGLDRVVLHGTLVYAASKVAVNTLTKVMAMEFGAYKIRVNSISPGLFKSEITQGLMQKDWLKNVALRTVPLRTFGDLHLALTSLARYLIHDSSQYVAGNVFIVEAGVALPGVPIFSSL